MIDELHSFYYLLSLLPLSYSNEYLQPSEAAVRTRIIIIVMSEIRSIAVYQKTLQVTSSKYVKSS